MAGWTQLRSVLPVRPDRPVTSASSMSPCRASAALPSPAAALVSPAVAAACPAGVELIGGLDGLAERQVAWQDDVFSAERDEHGALYRPRAYPGNGRELCHQLVVGETAQHVRVQPTVR